MPGAALPQGMMARELSVVGALARPALGDGPVELAALARETVAAGVARRALMLQSSRLPPARQRPAQLRLLRDAFDPVRRSARVRLFEFPNGDLVAVAPLPAPQLDEVRARLASMLDAAEIAEAIAELRLPDEAASLLATVERALGMMPTPAVRRGPKPAQRPALDGDALADAERRLARADIEAYLRREWVCRIVAEGGVPEPIWEERRVATEAVGDAVLDDRDAEAAPWLRRRLRRAIDRRLLADVMRAEEMRNLRALALPLTLESVIGPDFLRFDSMLPVALRGQVTLSFEAADVLGNPETASLVRDFCRLRSYRFGLEAGGVGAVDVLPAARARHDVLRLTWSPALPDLGSAAAEKLRAALGAGPEQVVMAGVDRPAAIAWGWEMGIFLFQGRLVEQRRPAR